MQNRYTVTQWKERQKAPDAYSYGRSFYYLYLAHNAKRDL